MGVREQKKVRIKDNIISAATAVFSSRGYETATLEEIAARAELGVGTLYNYFSSKADLFLAVKIGGFNLSVLESVDLSERVTDDVTDRTISYLRQITAPLGLDSKETWREIIAVAMGTLKTGDNLFHKLNQVDDQFRLLLEAFFDDLKNKEVLSETFPSDKASHVIYSIAFARFMSYVLCTETSYAEFETALTEEVRFVLDNRNI